MLSSSMDMLEESLIKKIDIMSEIEAENEKQKEGKERDSLRSR